MQADLKAFEALGIHGCTVVTCVTSQNTRKVSSIFPVPVSHVASQLDSVLEDVRLDAIKTGMLYSADIVKTVASRLKKVGGPLIVDPVMAATTGSSLHTEGFIDALISKLLPISTLVTPNLYEASRLSGIKITNEKSARLAGREILELGPKAVLLKGGHLKGEEAADYLFAANQMTKISSPRIPVEVHGTGCTLGSLIAGHIALGHDLEEAVRRSKGMIYKAILARERVGEGVPCANPLAVLRIEAGKAQMLENLEDVGRSLELLLDADLIPEVGTNIGHAVLGALEPNEVAAFDGRIVRVGLKARKVGSARFGASKHVARIVLAASSHDPNARCAMNLKYSETNLKACRRANMSVSTFDRAQEPSGVSSMTWGVHEAIKAHGSVPDVIYDEGGVGKEPMIRLLGGSPEEVLLKLKRIKSKLTPG